MDFQADIIREDGWKRTLKITVPQAEIDAAFEQATRAYRQKAKIPGFRPGKVPLNMITERYGQAIHQDVLETVVSQAFQGALRELKLFPIGNPSFSGLNLERESEMVFEAEIEVRPDIEIAEYKGLKLTKRIYEVTEEDITQAVDNIRDQAATTVEVSRPAHEGDVVVCNLQKIYDRQNRMKKTQFDGVKMELREDRVRPEFLKNIPGMTIGEGKEIEVNYPAEESDPDLAGNTVLYRAWLKTVSQKTLPEADDEFAGKVTDGAAQSIDQLRQALRDDLKRRAENAALRDLRGQIRKAIVDANQIPVPEGFLGRYLNDVSERLRKNNPEVTDEQVHSQFAPIATEQFRWDYVFFEIAKKEDIKVTDEEVSEIIKTWPPDAKERPDQENIRNTLMENRVFDAILSAAQVNEVPYTPPEKSRIITP